MESILFDPVCEKSYKKGIFRFKLNGIELFDVFDVKPR